MKKLAKHGNTFWAGTAITLGLWEATAVTTKKVPTITETSFRARARYRRRAELAIAAWLFGLAVHLFKH